MSLADALATPLLCAALGYLALHDIRTRRLPDAITYPLIVVGLGLAVLRDGSWPMAELIGAAAGFAVFALLGEGYFRLRGVDGLGLGDAKLTAAAGAWLGWVALPLLVLGASVPALCYALARRRETAEGLAFGPWICAAFAVLWGLRLMGAGPLSP